MQSQKQDGCTNPLFIIFTFFTYIHTKYKKKRGLQNLRFKKFPVFNNAGKVLFSVILHNDINCIKRFGEIKYTTKLKKKIV